MLVTAGADVFAGSPESTVDLGVAAGEFAVVAGVRVGTTTASAGCNALGANAAGQ